MSFDPKIIPGNIIDNRKLCEIFKCGPQGGMRRSHRTNTLVLVSDHTKSLYEDRWINNTMHYTGMGRLEDQDLDFHQNKTLAESQINNVEVHFFEVFKAQSYTYIGLVELAADPYQEIQPDDIGDLRKVWIFPLKLKVEASQVFLPESVITQKQDHLERVAQRISDEELERRAKYSRKGVGSRKTVSTTYERNLFVSEYAKRRAMGKCQLCNQPAPFNDKKGRPFLESHHIEWLSRGGEDTIENSVALCPNCHRKMHILEKQEDVSTLKASIA